MFDRIKFRRVMNKSGLTKRELAGLYGVTRQTLYTWLEHGPQQALLVERAERYTAGLLAGIDKNLLPFPGSLSPDQRKERLAKIARHLYTLTAPK
jgi:hypothetical protein